MLIEEIKLPAKADCAAAYKVAGTIIEMTMDGEYRVWSISPEPKLLLECGDYFAEAIALAFSGTCLGGEKMEKPVIKQNNSSKNKQGTYTHLVYSETGRLAGSISASSLKRMKAQLQCAECNAEEKPQCPLPAQGSDL